MATCPDCRGEVPGTPTCTRQHFQLGNRQVPRIRYGEERRPPVEYSFEEQCDDCGVEEGGFHHRGCAIEQCPICGDYAAVCHCWSHARQ